MKKILLVLCELFVLLTTFTLMGCTNENNNVNNVSGGNTGSTAYVRVDADGNVSSSGEYVLFGSYPQSKVTDETVAAALTASAGALPTKESDGEWTSCGYDFVAEVIDGTIGYDEGAKGEILASKTIEVYSWYIDVEYDGARYRGLYFLDYRPLFYQTTYLVDDLDGLDPQEFIDGITREYLQDKHMLPDPNNHESYQFYNGYFSGHVYWFKYESIKWRILDEKNGKLFLLSDKALDCREMDRAMFYHNKKVDGETYYLDNYVSSELRNWLNGSFYSTAFSIAEKDSIAVTTVDNGKNSSLAGDEYVYWCEDTEDKVFMLSEKEATNEDYGFNTDPDAYDEARRLLATDYALGLGCGTDGEYYDVEEGCLWRLRTFNSEGVDMGVVLTPDGDICKMDCENFATRDGIAPAIWLNIA
ncbi:MAG: DUF6273 domain-containing protein [Christensenellales bacterium]